MNTLKFIDKHRQILQENKELVDMWIVGLRSGKWVQTKGAMTNLTVENSACCLMVLEAECNNKVTDDFVWTDPAGTKHVNGMPSAAGDPLWFRDYASKKFMPESLIAVDGAGTPYNPAEWNDYLELTFDQIADLLEKGEIQFESHKPAPL